MSPLERLGLEVAAFELLGSRGKAVLLCALIDGGGRTVTKEKLQEARGHRFQDVETPTFKGLHARICWLREALEDVGIPNAIITAPYGRNEKSAGYSLPEPKRSQVIERLVEIAA